ncbi:MAG: DUF927 domain-containing protein [Clostridiales bacterium]|nr:DUF927 domain-containing protein [Clostridiales bacterium]MBQ1571024.1 DUF927 domain-containing protein [Clostridiales bacterium]
MLIDNISELSKDVLLSDEILKELYEYTGTEQIRVRERLGDRAKELKCKKAFEEMLRKYQAEFKREHGAPMNESEFFFPEDKDYPVLITGGWIATEKKIYCLTPFGEQVACTHPIIPIKILTNVETGDCKVKLAFKIRGVWQERFVDKSQLASASKIVDLARYGIRVTSENAKYLVKYLSDVEALNEDIIEEKRSMSTLGWVRGSDEFMPYGDSIEFDNEQSGLKNIFKAVQEPAGSETKWLELIKELRAEGRMEFLINLVASFASPIIEMVNALPFIVSLWGETGKGKTITLMLATSVWANPEEGAYISGARNTTTATEIKLGFLKNLPFMMDDVAQVRDEFGGEFSTLIMDLCAGIGKGRGTKDGGIRDTQRWLNVILTNAEQSMITQSTKGGAVNRIIEVEMDGSREIYKNGNRIANIIKANYGFAGRRFISDLQWEGRDEIRKMFDEYYKKIIDATLGTEHEKEEKQIAPMAILLTADELIERYIFEDGVRLDFDACVNLLKDKTEVSENERAFDYVMDTIMEKRINFVSSEDKNERFMVECWGYIDKNKESDEIYISSKVFSKILKEGGFSTKAFLSWAYRKGIVKEGDENKSHSHRIKKQINGMRTWCVRLCLPPESADFTEVSKDDIPFD